MNSLDLVFSGWNFFVKSPALYKLIFSLTILFLIITCFATLKIYRDNQRYHDFFIPKIRVFVEKQFNERTLSFDIQSLSDGPVYINQRRLVVFDTGNKDDALISFRKYGGVNPLNKEDKLPVFFIMDSPPGMGFDFTGVIKDGEYAMQSYKFIIVVYYNKNSSKNIAEQRFEYNYSVYRDGEEINGTINEVLSQRNELEIIDKKVSYE